MTLAVYPLVYLPVAASLRGADPGQEEVARSLGSGRVRTFARITLGQAKGAILRRLPAGRAGPAGRVRRVRDPRLPDLHHRDLHRVQRRTASPPPARCPWCWSCSACSCWPVKARIRGRGRVSQDRPDGPARHPAPAAGPGRAGRCWPVRRARPARAGRARSRSRRLLDRRRAAPGAVRRGQRLPARRRLATPPPTAPLPRRLATVLAVPGGPAGRPAHRADAAFPGAQHLPGAGHARRGHRLRPVLLHRALRGRVRLRDGACC